MNEKPIDSFTGKHRFLSNFYPARITYRGDTYSSVEHAYQAAKTDDFEARTKIRDAKTAGIAKRLGRHVKFRCDWEMIKLAVMHELILQKFQDNVLRAELMETGDRPLIEGNWWNDYFWGICRGRGENHLGKILMKVRDQFRSKDEISNTWNAAMRMAKALKVSNADLSLGWK